MEYLSNGQWVVNDFGLQSKGPQAPYEYNIPKERLLESGDYGDVYDWPPHVCEKTWVDADKFVEAYRKALEIHKTNEVDWDKFNRSVAAIRKY